MPKHPPPLRSDKYVRVGKATFNGQCIRIQLQRITPEFILNRNMAWALLKGDYDEVYLYEEKNVEQSKL